MATFTNRCLLRKLRCSTTRITDIVKTVLTIAAPQPEVEKGSVRRRGRHRDRSRGCHRAAPCACCSADWCASPCNRPSSAPCPAERPSWLGRVTASPLTPCGPRSGSPARLAQCLEEPPHRRLIELATAGRAEQPAGFPAVEVVLQRVPGDRRNRLLPPATALHFLQRQPGFRTS